MGTEHAFSSVFVTESDHGLAVTPTNCKLGVPVGPAPCNATNARVVSIDWVGSPDVGAHNISQRRAVVAVTYAEGAPNQAEVAPERAGPRFSRPPIDTLGLHLASPPWPLYSIDSPP